MKSLVLTVVENDDKEWSGFVGSVTCKENFIYGCDQYMRCQIMAGRDVSRGVELHRKPKIWGCTIPMCDAHDDLRNPQAKLFGSRAKSQW